MLVFSGIRKKMANSGGFRCYFRLPVFRKVLSEEVAFIGSS
jgi:hypothetical protein